MNIKHIKRRQFYNKLTLLLVIICMTCISCYRDPIDLNLEDIDPQLVIEGYITDQAGPYQIKISKTSGYNQLDNFPMVSGAEVFIQDNLGNSEKLTETEKGLYQSQSLRGMAGRTYTLQVLVEGKEYRASSKMPEALTLDYINYQNHGWEYTFTCTFTDRQGIEDFCRIKVFKNGELVDKYLYQGRYTDGEQIILDDFNVRFTRDEFVQVQLLTINKNMYEYLAMLNPNEGSGDYDPETPEFFAVSPANPKSNISNNALGYFSAHTVRIYNLLPGN